MSEHSSVLKLLKDGKLSEKPCAGEKRTFGKTLFRLLIHQRWLYSDYMSLFWEDPILFCTFMQKLYGTFCGSYQKYQPLVHLINQRHWRCQVNIMWEILSPGSPKKDSYVEMETLINIP